MRPILIVLALATALNAQTDRPRAPQSRTLLPADGISPLFQAALEATEEAVYNSLLRATSVTSRSGKAEAIPIDRVREILRGYPQR